MSVKSRLGSFIAGESKKMSRVEKVIADVVLNRSTALAPKDTGDLKANGRVYVKDGHHVVKFGDNDVPYARRRHFENKKNPQTLGYLKRGGDSVKKENIKKYVDMAR